MPRTTTDLPLGTVQCVRLLPTDSFRLGTIYWVARGKTLL